MWKQSNRCENVQFTWCDIFISHVKYIIHNMWKGNFHMRHFHNVQQIVFHLPASLNKMQLCALLQPEMDTMSCSPLFSVTSRHSSAHLCLCVIENERVCICTASVMCWQAADVCQPGHTADGGHPWRWKGQGQTLRSQFTRKEPTKKGQVDTLLHSARKTWAL